MKEKDEKRLTWNIMSIFAGLLVSVFENDVNSHFVENTLIIDDR